MHNPSAAASPPTLCSAAFLCSALVQGRAGEQVGDAQATVDPGPAENLFAPPLARLPHLESLEIRSVVAADGGGIPPSWLEPGAFPKLKR